MGSVLFLASWAVLMGPVTYAKHLVSGPRLPFTAAYFGSICLTLYFAVGVSLSLPPSSQLSAEAPRAWCHPPFRCSAIVSATSKRCVIRTGAGIGWKLTGRLANCSIHPQRQSTLLTLFSSIVQLACLAWYLVSYFPMGGTGLRFAARFGSNRVAAWMTD